ncbi:MAG: galactose mutarotase [Bacteroidales bacterium]|nr:galactose mutarotase [Bacteroidales bacterium]
MKAIKLNSLAASAIIALLGVSCSSNPEKQLTRSGLDPDNFVAQVNGKTTGLYKLTNPSGMEVCVTNFGGRLVSIMVPDKNGDFKDVVLGFDSIADYINIPSDFGAAIGRYANRINQGRLVIDGDSIQLPQNNFGHCLHGGPTGWQYQVYDVKQVSDNSITLVMNSPDGDNNFPGNVTAEVTYTLTDDNAIDIDYTATTDKTTVINMTNHSYFNLNGDPNIPVTNCMMQVNASLFTPVDSTYMTTGEIASVKETPFDFTEAKAVGEEITVDCEQLRNGNGYDHNWVLDTAGDDQKVAVTLSSPITGITLEVYTNEPGIQIYSGNFLDGTVSGKGGNVYNQRAGICLESQKYPDTPNKPTWPSATLEPGQTYHSHCVFKFGIQK